MTILATKMNAGCISLGRTNTADAGPASTLQFALLSLAAWFQFSPVDELQWLLWGLCQCHPSDIIWKPPEMPGVALGLAGRAAAGSAWTRCRRLFLLTGPEVGFVRCHCVPECLPRSPVSLPSGSTTGAD